MSLLPLLPTSGQARTTTTHLFPTIVPQGQGQGEEHHAYLLPEWANSPGGRLCCAPQAKEDDANLRSEALLAGYLRY
jgi:hypothetical protein